MDTGATQAVESTQAAAKLRIFLSYSRKDESFIGKLADALTARGYLPDFDRSPHDKDNVTTGISAEDDWWKRLREMIEAADVMVFAVSPDSAASSVCDEEIAYARSLSKRVIAVLHRPIDFASAPPRLAALNVKIRLSEDEAFATGIEELCHALDRDVAWLREQTRLLVAATDWDQSGKREEEMLRGAEISEAEAWSARRPASAPEVPELVLSFLAASRLAQGEREARERLALKRQRNLQAWVGGLIVVAMGIAIAGGWYVIDRQRFVAQAQSTTLARTAGQFEAQGAHANALRMAVLAARDTFLTPASEEAAAMLAKTANASPIAAQLVGHVGDINGVVFSADGKRVLSWGKDKSVRLWDTGTGKLVVAPVMHNAPVNGARFLAGGTQVLSWSEDGEVRHWSAAMGTLIGSPMAHGLNVQRVAVSGDEKLAAVMVGGVTDAEQGTVLRDLATGSPVGSPMPEGVDQLHTGYVYGAAFSRDGSRLLTWGMDGAAHIWSVATQKEIVPPMLHEGAVTSAVWSPDETRVLTASGGITRPDNSARMWDASTGAQIGATMQHTGSVVEAFYIDDGARVVTRSWDGAVRLWNGTTGEPYGNGVSHVRQSPQGVVPDIWARMTGGSANVSVVDAARKRLMTSGSDGIVRIWDLGTGQPATPPMLHPVAVNYAAFVADGQRVVTLDEANTVRVWDTASGRNIGREIRGDVQWAVSPDGSTVATFWKGPINLWDLRVDKPPLVTMPSESIVQGALAVHGGDRVLTWTREGVIRIWSAATSKLVIDPIRNDGPIWKIELAPDGQRFLVIGDVAQQWDLSTARKVGPAMGMDAGLEGARYADEGRRILTWASGATRLWDAESGNQIGVEMRQGVPDVMFQMQDLPIPFSNDPSAKRGAVLSPDGAHVLTWSADKAARLWDAKTGAPVGAPMPQKTNAIGAVYSHDGSVIVTWGGVGGDFTAHVWQGSDGAPTGVTLTHDSYIRGALFSNDDRWIITWSNDRSVRIWDVATGKPVAPPMAFAGGETDFVGGVRLFPDGKRLMTWDSNGAVRLWDIGAGRQIGEAMQAPGRGAVISAELSPNGAYLLTAHGSDRGLPTVHVWDFTTHRPVGDFGIGMGVVNGASWLDDGRILTWGENKSAEIWQVPWLITRKSMNLWAQEVCAAKLLSLAAEVDTENGKVWRGLRRIDAADIEAAPVLRGREGEDVCAWTPTWYDGVLDVMFAWAR